MTENITIPQTTYAGGKNIKVHLKEKWKFTLNKILC